MSFKNAFGIYQLIQQILEKSNKPLTCVDLWDNDEIRNYASSSDRVSDYLGHMYRRGVLGREPAPPSQNSAARFAYYWKKAAKVPTPVARTLQPRLETGDSGRPRIEVDEKAGTLTMEFHDYVVVVKKK